MDVQARLYKMIEVMVLYVHILRNLCLEKDKELATMRYVNVSISNKIDSSWSILTGFFWFQGASWGKQYPVYDKITSYEQQQQRKGKCIIPV